MALYCKFGNGGPGGSDNYYICSADQYCCELDQCCYTNNRYNLPQLWYCWFFVLTGILICSLISGKFCKKRHNVRHVTVASSRVPAHNRQQGTTIVHPSPAMGNVWTVFPPGYSTNSIVVTDSSTRVHDYSSTDYSSSTTSSASSEDYAGEPPAQPHHPHTEAMYPHGVSISYHPSMGNVYPPQPGYNTVIITDTLYEGDPPSYESVMRSQAHTQHPNVVPVN